MGNTELSLPGAEFLSFRKSQQGLFGAKAIGKFGPMDLTAIASKQEGQTARESFVGQSRRDSLVIRDADYSKRKYFFVADPAALADSAAGLRPFQTFELFLDDKIFENNRDLNALRAFAYTDARNPTQPIGRHPGWFHRLTENVDYTFSKSSGVLTLEQAISPDHALACIYVTAAGDSAGGFIAGIDSTVAPPVEAFGVQLLSPPQSELWDDTRGFASLRQFELKNTYQIGARNIVPESLELIIRRRASGAGEPRQAGGIERPGGQRGVRAHSRSRYARRESDGATRSQSRRRVPRSRRGHDHVSQPHAVRS
jgi:hypothetical protein